MAKEGEYFITSKGRRFRKGLKIERGHSHSTPLYNRVFYGDPLNPHSELISESTGWVIGDDDEDLEHKMDRSLIETTEPRSSISNTVEVLDDLKEGPVASTIEDSWENDTLEWLAKHGYVRFVPFSRSQDVNFISELDKKYGIR